MEPGAGASGCAAERREAGPEASAPEGPAATAAPSREAADEWPPSSPSPSGLLSRPRPASLGVGEARLPEAGGGRMAAGGLLEAGLARVLFYPTLLYTLFRGKVPGRAHRDWYHRIDPTVLLGALPLRNMTRRLVQDENVRGVITMNEEYETRFLCNSSKEWKKVGVEQLRLSTVDMTGVPTLANLQKGVQFALKYQSLGQSVYVHCKAGRSRSATMVAAYLIQREREREAETQAEGEADSMPGARCGTQSQDSRIATWAKGVQLESRGGCKSHHQDPVTHPHQIWPVGSSQRVPQGDYCRGSKG
ncbi:phosphatidylglycerophosphatase and protein-tyrosine phosphatase 1 isoform X2 [Canis lupus dingo]|uniref:phosphatidylglycerophosphatase and protein-tyrosine phosphatase 1 isoform X2 n=1 Tax=Canis lupus dingo TaxID=286419 RepID=UPI0020C2AAB5|nr:phosphatidylglycerophosphatase and protein-tyrosine phosphatase 1 isoform X2 [Canis lupus dingo]